jgi:uracil phosphoribosyltransferase
MRVEVVEPPHILKMIENVLENKYKPAELVSLFSKLSSYLACEMIKDLSINEQQATLKAMKETLKNSL